MSPLLTKAGTAASPAMVGPAPRTLWLDAFANSGAE